MEKQEFMYKSIDDAVGTIRAMDIKSNMLIAIIIATIIALSKMTTGPLSVITILVGMGASVVFIYGVVLPGLNPTEGIQNIDNLLDNKNEQKLFFPYGIKDADFYYKTLNGANKENLIKVLVLERLKLQNLVIKKISFYKIGVYWGFLPFFLLAGISFSTTI